MEAAFEAVPRRAGSATVYISRASTTPGNPTARNTTCQDRISPISGRSQVSWLELHPVTNPPSKNAIPEPMYIPMPYTLSAVARRCGGK